MPTLRGDDAMPRDRAASRLRSCRSTAGAILLLLVLGGCDAFDPSALLPRIAEQSTPAEGGPADPSEATRESVAAAEVAPPEPQGPRSPDMQSIGPEASRQVYYQFIDDRGQVQFVERLSAVPAAWRDRVGYVEMSQPPPLSPLEARQSWKLSATRTAEILLAANAREARNAGAASSSERRRMDDFAGSGGDVLLYYAKWCGYCRKAKAHLDREGVAYELRNVDNDAIGRELREKTGRGGIPVLDFGGEILRGYSEQNYDRAIRTIRG